MTHKEGFFKGVRDIEIFRQQWQPTGEAKAALLLVHGLAEHGGRYLNIVDRFVPAGFAVHAFDHPGHGRSGGPRMSIDRFKDYTDTLDACVRQIRGERPDIPMFLVGHSLGGLICAAYLLERQAGLAGAAFSAPGIKEPASVSSAVKLVGKALSVLAPGIGVSRLDFSGLSRDPSVAQAALSDPLMFKGKITARLGAEMLKTMQRVVAEAARITLPILILQGDADPIVDPTGARILHDAAGSTDKSIKVYQGLLHELFNEPEREQVFDDLEEWLNQRLEKTPS